MLIMSSNVEQNLAISRLCDDIMASNGQIFYVSCINRYGKTIESKSRNDRIVTKMSKQEIEMFCMQRTLQMSLNKEFDDLIGPLNFITIQRETLFELVFPYSDGLILVMCDLDVISNYLAQKILFTLRNFDWTFKDTIYA